MKQSAIFSTCKKYRYQLQRTWDESKPSLLYIGLNPSVASSCNNDPTIRRLIHFTTQSGCGGFRIVNLFAYITPNPKVLFKAKNPIGECNDAYLKPLPNELKTVLIWGNHGQFKDRNRAILNRIEKPYCLTITKEGAPGHPLYLKNDCSLIPYLVEAKKAK